MGDAPRNLSAAPTRPATAAVPDDWIALSEPDLGELEPQLVMAALHQPRWSGGPMVELFEARFADWVGRRNAVSVASGTLGCWLALRALGLGAGDEVIASPYSWHQVGHAVELAGARIVFTEINYWSGCPDPARVETQITPATRALIVGNVNGHPAAWREWQALAQRRGLLLIEDSTEAIGSRYQGRMVGGFGDASVFDFSQPCWRGYTGAGWKSRQRAFRRWSGATATRTGPCPMYPTAQWCCSSMVCALIWHVSWRLCFTRTMA